jgi:hypothetical protein
MSNIKDLESKLKSGRISRRDFMQGAVALGVTASVASGIMAKAAQAARIPGRGRGHLKPAEGKRPCAFPSHFQPTSAATS